MRSPQNVKCLVLGNCLFNPDNDHSLLGYSATNFLAAYPFFCLNSLIKTWSAAENTILLLFMLFWLRQQMSPPLERLCNAILVTNRYFVTDIQHSVILVRNNISQWNLAVTSGIWHLYCTMSWGSVFHQTRCILSQSLSQIVVKAYHDSQATWKTKDAASSQLYINIPSVRITICAYTRNAGSKKLPIFPQRFPSEHTRERIGFDRLSVKTNTSRFQAKSDRQSSLSRPNYF